MRHKTHIHDHFFIIISKVININDDLFLPHFCTQLLHFFALIIIKSITLTLEIHLNVM